MDGRFVVGYVVVSRFCTVGVGKNNSMEFVIQRVMGSEGVSGIYLCDRIELWIFMIKTQILDFISMKRLQFQ